MTLFLELLVVPVIYLVVLGVLAFRKERRLAAVSLAFFLVAIAAGYWAITRSRSSTAGIAFIFLPSLAVLAGLLGMGFARWRSAGDALSRLAGWLCLVFALALYGALILGGWQSVAHNRERDAQYAAQEQGVIRERAAIAATLASNPGHETETLDREIRARTGDRAFLIAALESPAVSPDLLDSLTRSADLGIALLAVRNPSTRAATLERVYREHANPDYFFQALAAHAHTPPDVMRALYERPGTIGWLDFWLASNAATPRDVLERIARGARKPDVFYALLRNPALDCGLLDQTAETVKKVGSGGQLADVASRLAELRPTLCR